MDLVQHAYFPDQDNKNGGSAKKIRTVKKIIKTVRSARRYDITTVKIERDGSKS